MAREHWGSRFGFILAAAGAAVGLGNIWRFPALAGQNGGAAFVFVYAALSVVVGTSLLLAELAIGRLAQRSAVGAFSRLRGGAWIGVGALGVLAAFLIQCFYAVIGGWTLAYMVKTAGGALSVPGMDYPKFFENFAGNAGEPLFYLGLYYLFLIAVCSSGIGKGVERTVKLLMPALFLLLIFLAARTATLPGAAAGLKYYLYPDFSKVSFALLRDALSQMFFSLSLGVGVMIAYGSYLRRNERLPSSALWIVGLDLLAAFAAGLVIFPATAVLGIEPAAGTSLTFATMPGLFVRIPGGTLFGIAFFLLLFIAALTSSLSYLEACISFLSDQFQLKRRHAVFAAAFSCFLIGVPCSLSMGPWTEHTLFGLRFMDFLDAFTAKLLSPTVGLGVALFAGWVLWPAIKAEALGRQSGERTLWVEVWKWILRFVAPLAVVLILIAGFL